MTTWSFIRNSPWEDLNMRLLLIKTSSMGDLIHTFPAITDASLAIPNLTVDWMVEDTFSMIPKWHPYVTSVIPVSLRKWRKGIFSAHTKSGFKTLYSTLRKAKYDLILDAQGLFKSAFLSLFAKGERAGLDFKSARESLASLFYQHKYRVDFYQHAVSRMRLLFCQALGYPHPTSDPQFGISQDQFTALSNVSTPKDSRFRTPHPGEWDIPYIVFLHGTTWASKEWPQSYWQQLATIASQAGYRIKMSGGNDIEMERAISLSRDAANVEILPYLTIENMAICLAKAKGVIAVDTGLGHLAAALNVPTVSIYGATHPKYTGAIGSSSINLAVNFPCAPCLNRTCTYQKKATVTPACYSTITPAQVWQSLLLLLHQP